MSQNEKTPKLLSTLDGNTLMAQTFEPLRFSVEKILPHGLFILAGSPKIGKSWLSLDLCQAVAIGGKLWDFNAEQGDVLHLALEDNYNRLQNRLKQIDAEKLDIARLHLATASFGLQDGLLEQIHNFIAVNPATNLIVIDTLEHIRNGEQDKNLYSCDYRDMNRLREITNAHRLTLLLVHHTRTRNFNRYALKMLLDGYVVHLDLTEFQNLANEVNKVGVNINQIAKTVNANGMIFGDDMNQLKEMVDEIWRLLKSYLSDLLSKSR